MKITCNGKTSESVNNATLTICHGSLGCSIIAGNDLYDLGFTHDDLTNHDLRIAVGNTCIVFESQKTHQNRLTRQLMEDLTISESAAKHFLRHANFNYAQAKLTIEMMRLRGKQPDPSEIKIGEPELCVLRPLTVEDIQNEAVQDFIRRTATASEVELGGGEIADSAKLNPMNGRA